MVPPAARQPGRARGYPERPPVKLIVQIPCLNEEATLPATIADLPRQIEGIDEVELLVIDDGSTDRTVEVAREQRGRAHRPADQQPGGWRPPSRRVSTPASSSAPTSSSTPTPTTSTAAPTSPKLVAPILAGEADMVVGDRQVERRSSTSPAARSALQRLGSWRRAHGSRAPRSPTPPPGSAPTTARRRSALLVVDNFTYTLESLIQAGKMLVAVDQVEVGTNPQTRESRLFDSTGAYVRRNALSILRIYARYEPLRVFATAGARRRHARPRRLAALPDRLDLQRRLDRPHPVADPRRGALHRRASSSSRSA